MPYQFRVDGRRSGPVRQWWEDAAQDAVNAGYGTWKRGGRAVSLSDSAGAEIVRIEASDPSDKR